MSATSCLKVLVLEYQDDDNNNIKQHVKDKFFGSHQYVPVNNIHDKKVKDSKIIDDVNSYIKLL